MASMVPAEFLLAGRRTKTNIHANASNRKEYIAKCRGGRENSRGDESSMAKVSTNRWLKAKIPNKSGQLSNLSVEKGCGRQGRRCVTKAESVSQTEQRLMRSMLCSLRLIGRRVTCQTGTSYDSFKEIFYE